MDKETTKIRIVLDAASKHQGTSLNDFILKGPKLQNNLFDILVRFRQYPVALVCDVSEMYLRIYLNPSDRKYHRILFRENKNMTPDIYEFNVLTFGDTSCPFLAQYVTRHHAEQNAENFPEAAAVIKNSTYMDDSMTSTEDVQSGKELYTKLSNLWKSAGMYTRKWLSNSEEVLAEIPQQDRAKEISLEENQLPTTKALGVMWKADTDTLCFKTKVPEKEVNITKRQFLKILASLFDPLGFLAPYIIRGKMYLQEVWLENTDWDESLSPEVSKKTNKWIQELESVPQLHIPRCLQDLSRKVTGVTLHFFCDASEDAYGSVGYYRCEYADNGPITSHLIASKTKVAPLKAMSIPRLELEAALTSTQLSQAVSRSLKIDKSNVFHWSDSMNVLWWITRRSRYFTTFVAHRVAQIQETSSANRWEYVPTKQNPADLASRGTTIKDLNDNSLWWSGPTFLTKPKDQWPRKKEITASSEARKEIRKKKLKAEQEASQMAVTFHVRELNISANSLIQAERFSSLLRFKRVLAWILRFCRNSRVKDDERMRGELSIDELSDSESSIIRSMQVKVFSEEYLSLKDAKTLKHTSKLIGLQPFIDDDGLLRARTRLEYASYLPDDVKFPIILPRKEWVTKLVVRSYHETNGHVKGVNHLLAEISQRFWIISAREEIKQTEDECNECIRRKAKVGNQLMAPLPDIRFKEPLQAFSRTAIDYAGPFLTKQGRGKVRRKRYLSLFTCLLTRAVHLEVAYGLDTDSFLNSFYRMVNRRGRPEEMLSDNGSNFIGGERELRELVDALDEERIKKSAANRGIKWTFTPPHAPHFGGVHEIMIKSSKRAIYAVMKNAELDDEELTTVFTAAESLINSRPLTYQSASPNDDVPLTPNHFLTGRLGGEFAPSSVDDEITSNPRKRWRRIQEISRHFWSRWIREWLPSLRKRTKWTELKKDVIDGSVVLIVDLDAPRRSWPLGRVMETYAGKDGHIRTVKVRMNGKDYIRPIAKICPLELHF